MKLSSGAQLNRWTISLAAASLVAFTGLASIAVAQSAPAPAPGTPTIPLNILSEHDFCKNMSDSFSKLAVSLGREPLQARAIGQKAATMISSALTSNQIEAFVNPASFQLTPAQGGEKPLMNTAQIVAATLGINRAALLVKDPADLRYLPYAQKFAEVVIVTASGEQLPPDRIAAVAEYAKREQVRISAVWTGQDRSPQTMTAARNLAWLVASTGGIFADIGRTSAPCGGTHL